MAHAKSLDAKLIVHQDVLLVKILIQLILKVDAVLTIALML
jgi:hypothetical protein